MASHEVPIPETRAITHASPTGAVPPVDLLVHQTVGFRRHNCNSSAGVRIRRFTCPGHAVLNSRPGAAYTLYLDVAGFNFTGSWFGISPSTGTAALAFNGVSTGSFTTAEIADIANFWAHTANAYAPFNVNVTTVDPAAAAGRADTDAHRQAWYDTQARVMHTIITSNTVWDGGNGGRSKLGVLNKIYGTAGINGGAGAGNHTNWVFDFLDQGPDELIDYRNVVHENGHAFGLSHQSDFSMEGVQEYSFGDDDYAPYMGGAFFANLRHVADRNHE